MGRVGWIGVAVMLVASIVAFAVYSTAQAVNDMCIARARDVVDRADPLDRSPPPAVVTVVEREVGREKLADELSTVLLDRLDCTGRSEDWIVVRPVLSWQIQRSFSDAQRVAVFASTIDTGAGTLGLAAGARKFYARALDELDQEAVACLVRKARGTPRGRWSTCGTEGFPVYGHPEKLDPTYRAH